MRSTSHALDRQSVMVDSAPAPVIALTVRGLATLHHQAGPARPAVRASVEVAIIVRHAGGAVRATGMPRSVSL